MTIQDAKQYLGFIAGIDAPRLWEYIQNTLNWASDELNDDAFEVLVKGMARAYQDGMRAGETLAKN